MNSDFYVPPGGPPPVAPPSRDIYALMGEANIFRMLADFYAELAASPIRDMFPKDMERASQKSALFFVGLLGGPPLYQQKYGSPMLRARHTPFPINEEAREIWVNCFEKILAEAPARYNFPAQHLPIFQTFIREFSGWMVNKRSPGQANDGSMRIL
jgi:hemoglobin